MTRTNRRVEFDPAELVRIRNAARALGTSYVEFIHDATMQAVSEVEAEDNERRLVRALAASPFVGEKRAARCTCHWREERWPAANPMMHDEGCARRRAYEARLLELARESLRGRR